MLYSSHLASYNGASTADRSIVIKLSTPTTLKQTEKKFQIDSTGYCLQIGWECHLAFINEVYKPKGPTAQRILEKQLKILILRQTHKFRRNR